MDDGQAAISVDAKKKELIGDFQNGGREWQPEREPERVRVHFIDTDLGKAIPYGIYDIRNNGGWVSVGDTADTAQFAVESIRRWWGAMERRRFPRATRLLVAADAGGSNGYRLRAWKVELAKLGEPAVEEVADRLGTDRRLAPARFRDHRGRRSASLVPSPGRALPFCASGVISVLLIWMGVPFARRPAYTRSRHTPGLISCLVPFTPGIAALL